MIKKIVKLLPHDKALHFIAGVVIGLLMNVLCWAFGADVATTRLVVLIVVLMAGVAKDWYDYKSYGRFDWYDVLATVLGGVVVAF